VEKLSVMPHKILILAGTNEARLLANYWVEQGHFVTSSFAGVTSNPKLPAGEIHIGGFGGVEGLRKFIAAVKFDFVIDATHPFAAQISSNVAEAYPQVLRIERPAWVPQLGESWVAAPDHRAAFEVLPIGARVLLTIGRKEALMFSERADLSGVMRMIESPPAVPNCWSLILERPPFDLESEIQLMRQHQITHLVTKNSGGEETAAKLVAAFQLGVQIVMIDRPKKPDVRTFSTIDAIAAWVASR
jgi:precorrin-6A/cobalt-precorrin-6A reductase